MPKVADDGPALDALYVTPDEPHQQSLFSEAELDLAVVERKIDAVYVTRFQKERWTDKDQPYPRIDAKFLQGSRLEDFHAKQFRLRLLSIILHETNHLVYPNEPETSIRERSLNFYHDALAAYTENAIATLSFTLDRSFSRLE